MRLQKHCLRNSEWNNGILGSLNDEFRDYIVAQQQGGNCSRIRRFTAWALKKKILVLLVTIVSHQENFLKIFYSSFSYPSWFNQRPF